MFEAQTVLGMIFNTTNIDTERKLRNIVYKGLLFRLHVCSAECSKVQVCADSASCSREAQIARKALGQNRRLGTLVS